MCATPPGTHRLSSLPKDTQQWPSQPGRNSRNGQVAGAGSWGVDSSRNQGRNKIKRSWQENTIPAVSERARRLQVPSCLRVNEGQLRPRLADAGTSQGPVVQPGLEGTWSLGCPPTAPQLFRGARNHSISAPFFFYLSCLCLPAQAPQHGVSARAVPSIRPSPCSYFRERQEVFF